MTPTQEMPTSEILTSTTEQTETSTTSAMQMSTTQETQINTASSELPQTSTTQEVQTTTTQEVQTTTEPPNETSTTDKQTNTTDTPTNMLQTTTIHLGTTETLMSTTETGIVTTAETDTAPTPIACPINRTSPFTSISIATNLTWMSKFHDTSSTRRGTSSTDSNHTRTGTHTMIISSTGSLMDRLERANRSLPTLPVSAVLGALAITGLLLAITGVSYTLIKARDSVNEHTPLLQT